MSLFFQCTTNKKLDDIIELLQHITKRDEIMATTLAQLDAGLATLAAEVTTLTADVTALIAKVNSGQDFTNELNTVQGSLAALQSSDAAAQAVLNPPASPPSS